MPLGSILDTLKLPYGYSGKCTAPVPSAILTGAEESLRRLLTRRCPTCGCLWSWKSHLVIGHACKGFKVIPGNFLRTTFTQPLPLLEMPSAGCGNCRGLTYEKPLIGSADDPVSSEGPL